MTYNLHPKMIESTFNNGYTKYKCKGTQKLTTEQYLQKIRPQLHGMINNFKTSNG